jgi:hypothetical protein
MVNIPGLVLRDLQFLFYLNAAGLLITALCMAAVIVYYSVIVFKNAVAKGALNEQREYLD